MDGGANIRNLLSVLCPAALRTRLTSQTLLPPSAPYSILRLHVCFPRSPNNLPSLSHPIPSSSIVSPARTVVAVDISQPLPHHHQHPCSAFSIHIHLHLAVWRCIVEHQRHQSHHHLPRRKKGLQSSVANPQCQAQSWLHANPRIHSIPVPDHAMSCLVPTGSCISLCRCQSRHPACTEEEDLPSFTSIPSPPRLSPQSCPLLAFVAHGDEVPERVQRVGQTAPAPATHHRETWARWTETLTRLYYMASWTQACASAAHVC